MGFLGFRYLGSGFRVERGLGNHQGSWFGGIQGYYKVEVMEAFRVTRLRVTWSLYRGPNDQAMHFVRGAGP